METLKLWCDDNRVNQRYFKTFVAVPNQTWLTENGLFLLFDFVHLVKSFQNNWLTEKTKEIVFYENGVAKIAKWSHLVALYRLVSSHLVTFYRLVSSHLVTLYRLVSSCITKW